MDFTIINLKTDRKILVHPNTLVTLAVVVRRGHSCLFQPQGPILYRVYNPIVQLKSRSDQKFAVSARL